MDFRQDTTATVKKIDGQLLPWLGVNLAGIYIFSKWYYWSDSRNIL